MSYLKTQTDSRGVTTISFNRPEALNAMNREFMDELTITLTKLNNNTRILVLEGSGKHFCAGADINWMKASAILSVEQNKEDAMALSTMLNTLNTYKHPTIAKVHGAAFGGGTGVVCCCDIVVATENARFSFSEVRLGITPSTISPYAIAAIGPRSARRYFLSGEQIDAVEAYRIGLAHDVCSTDNLELRVEEKIDALLKCSPEAQSNAKQLIADVSGKPISDKLRDSLAEHLANIRTSDNAQEGLAAFLEKRTPNWEG